MDPQSNLLQMRIVAISDTHGFHGKLPKLPDGDLLIHSGDCTDDAGQAALRSFLVWFESQPHKRKILVAGNHDWAFEKWPGPAEAMVKEIAPSVTYLYDSGCEIDGLKFWGSPVQPEFMGWAFNRQRGTEIRHHWDKIPDDTDVLITHGPAFGKLDVSGIGNEKVGCRDLYEAILRVRPRLHVFGHIHHSWGTTYEVHDCGSKTTYINGAICNEAYRPINKPLIYEVRS
jgi:predicted phosphodiesterase